MARYTEIGWLVVAVVAGLACTSPNPAFDPGSSVDGSPPPPPDGAPPPPPDAGRRDLVRPPADAEVDQLRPRPDAAPAKAVGLDVLFVIDNSPGMDAAQKRLARDVDSLLSRLDALPGGASYRIAVVSSDMGVGPHINKACSANGDAGALQLPPWCPATVNGKPFVERSGGAANVDDVDDAVSCMVGLGAEGCGFEQPLESMHAALVGSGGFLRPDAALLVVILGNEDDCSAADPSLYDPYEESFGPYASYRCYQFGVLCGGQQPPSAPHLASGCVPGQAHLHPVKTRYVDPLLALKPKGWVGVLALAGPVPDPIQVVEAENYQGTYWKVSPSCASSSITGDPAVRLRAFVKGFGALGSFESICSNSYRQALVQALTGLLPLF